MSAVTLIGEEHVSDDGVGKYAERVKAEARSLLDTDLKLWDLEVDSDHVKVYTRPVSDTEVNKPWAYASYAYIYIYIYISSTLHCPSWHHSRSASACVATLYAVFVAGFCTPLMKQSRLFGSWQETTGRKFSSSLV